MIPIAKGKFSQPRQPRRDDSKLFQQPAPPVEEVIPESVPDRSMDETMLLTGTFVPVQSETPVPPAVNVTNMTPDTMTFEEEVFMEETAEDPPYQEPYQEHYTDRGRPGKKNSRQNKNRKILIISICAASLLLLSVIIGGVLLFAGANKDDGLILNNVTVAGVNVGGMTPEEAAAAIHRATDLTFTVDSMMVHLPDTILEFSPKDTGAKLDVSAAVEAAYNYGRTGTAEENKKAKADSLTSNHTIALLPYLNLNLDFIRGELDAYGEYFNSDYEDSSWTLDGKMPELEGDKFDEKAKPQTLVLKPGKPGRYVDIDKVYNAVLDAYSMNEFVVKTEMSGEEQMPEPLDLAKIHEMLHTDCVDASMDMDTFEVTMEVYGYTFDLEKALKLSLDYGTTVEIPMEYIVPKVLSENLSDKLFRDVLAYCETPHTDDENRNTNLKLACKAINGYILMPGDTFDYNEVLGQRTEEKGYKPAGALQAGTSTVEVGGGICQVSSTLYYCTLLSDLEIVTRRSHSLPSSYMPMMGVDATVSWGGPHFRFKNNTDYPIRIEAEVDDDFVKVKLLGTDEKDYYVKMEYKIVEILDPDTIEETYTAEEAKALGYRDGYVKQQPVTGYTVYSYKCKYDKETDKLISREYEATSNYVKKDKIVIVVLPEATEPPTTEAPPDPEPSDPPATQPPVTDPPATQPPATDPPVTEPDAGGISDAPSEGTDAP